MDHTTALLEYKLILEYIKNNSKEDFEKLLVDYFKMLENRSKDDIINSEMFLDTGLIKRFVPENQKVIDFLRTNSIVLPAHTVYFEKFIHSIDTSKIDIYLRNIDELIKLGFTNVYLFNEKNSFILSINGERYKVAAYKVNDTWVYIYETEIEKLSKVYTDGIIRYQKKHLAGSGTITSPYFLIGGAKDCFNVELTDYNWIIQTSIEEGNITKTLYLNKAFDFNLEQLPTQNELESLTYPDSFSTYVKKLFKKTANK